MEKRYAIAKDSICADCLVTPGAYEGVLERLTHFTILTLRLDYFLYIYLKGLLSNTEKKNVESIAYFHGEDRQPLQMFIGQVDWNDDAILDELVKQVAKEIGIPNGKDAYRVEECFHRGKGECGLSDYQVRNWRGWHHHVALSMLGLWFLTKELLHQKKVYRR